MANPVEVVIVDDAPNTLEKLKRLLDFEEDIKVVGTADDAESGIETARRLNPNVILMDVNLPGVDGIQATESLSSQLPNVPVVIISVQDDREYLRRAMQAGAREYLVKPFSADELVAAIRRVNEMASATRPHTNGHVAQPVPPPAPIDTLIPEGPGKQEVYPGLKGREETGRVIAVFSAKGGVGKSTLAINLAAALAKESAEDVALADLDLQFGDVGILLGVHVQGSFADIASAFPNVDGLFIGGLMPQVEGGLRVLPAPLTPELADLVTAEHVRSTLQILAASFGHVVVDTSSHLNDVALEVLDRADKIVLVTNLNISAIKETKLAFKLFDDLRIPRNRLLVVVNQFDGPWEVTLPQLETSLRQKVDFKLPNQPKWVQQSISKGLPFTTVFPEAEISQRVRDIARFFVRPKADSPAAPAKKRGWL